MQGELALAQRREVVAAARTALAGLADVVHQCPEAELGPLLGELDLLGLATDAAKVAVVAEATGRGLTGSRPAWVAGWALKWAPSLRAGGARVLARVAEAFGRPADAPVRAAVDAGRIPLRSAAVVLTEADRLRPRLAEGAEPHVLAGLIDMAEQHGPRGCRLLRPALLARYGLVDELQGEQDRARQFVALSQPHEDGTGLFEYRLALDVEAKAVLESAIGALAAPRPSADAPDLRPSDQRRGDALVELVRRAVAAGSSVPTQSKAQLFVTIDHLQLAARLAGSCPGCGARSTANLPGAGARWAAGRDRLAGGAWAAGGDRAAAEVTEGDGLLAGLGALAAGSVIGGPEAGTLLAPQTMRRIACDASLVPVVLGSAGEVLDWGRERRLFTPAQIKRLWLRDAGCTYPGCSVPAAWCDAHHLIHWADGGPSDLANAGLLCGWHHTRVHTRRLAATLGHEESGLRVRWDLTPGSYDALLAEQRTRRRA